MSALLVGICGWGESGKNAAGEHLQAEYRINTIGFADPIEAMLVELGIMDAAYLSSGMKNAAIPELGNRTARHFKQSLGDWIRHEFGQDALIRIVNDVWTDLAKAGEVLVVRDVRTDEEVDFVRGNAGVMWWLQRPGAEAANDHHTESFDRLFRTRRMSHDVVIHNNGDIRNLHSQLDNALVVCQRRRVVPA